MQSFKKHIEEAYKATSEKSQFGGHRAHLKNPQGKTSYLGSASYAKPEHAKGEAQAYHDAYHNGPVKNNETGANRAVQAYRAKHKEHMHVKNESTAEYGKSIEKEKEKRLTPKDKDKLDKVRALLSKEKMKESVELDEATNAEIHKVLGPTKNAAQGIAALKKAFKVNDAQAKAMMDRVMKEEVELDESVGKIAQAHGFKKGTGWRKGSYIHPKTGHSITPMNGNTFGHSNASGGTVASGQHKDGLEKHLAKHGYTKESVNEVWETDKGIEQKRKVAHDDTSESTAAYADKI